MGARVYLDLKQRKDNGETVDSNDIKKHKKDVLRIASELMLEKVTNLPNTVKKDIDTFIDSLEKEQFDDNSLRNYGLKNEEVMEVLKRTFLKEMSNSKTIQISTQMELKIRIISYYLPHTNSKANM